LLWHGFITDITEQKNTQEILREKERMLSESQRVAHIGFWSLDLITDTLIWSDQMYSIHGVRKETFCHSQAGFMELIHPEDLLAMECWINDCRTGGLHKGIDYRIILSNGTVSFISCTGEMQCHIDNKTQRIVGICQDITEHKHLEQQDQEHLNQLAHVTRLGLMGEMASGIAHEVNQPLTAIANYAQVTINLMKNENPDLIKLSEVAEKIQDQALRAGQIIHRMKGFCKSNAQKLSTSDMNKLINDCVSLCADGLKQNNIMIRLELEDNLPVMNIDQIQIEQVLINLIRNGIDAILGAPEKRQGQIIIDSYLTPKNEIQIRVNDNGTGISEDQQQKILMPFHTTKADGMGMGLSISRSLIEAHNGTLQFNSKFGKGSTFYFTLPVEIAER
jgi:PAS domain S-box-containing protein